MGTPALHGVRADCTPAPICGPCVLIAAGLVKAHLHDVTTVKPHRATVTLGDVGVLCKGTAVVHEDGRMEFKSDDGKYELQIGPREPPPGRDQPLDD